ncbi:MAG: hypothetical protein HFJ84_11125 [Clostridiales bacterium]|jgi:hypothetical protein|nr:hypothetical protein [Clostridiales bacterium]
MKHKPKALWKKTALLLVSACCCALSLTACGNDLEELKQYETPSLQVISPTLIQYTEPFSFVGKDESEIAYLFDDQMMLGKHLFEKSQVDYQVISKKEVTKPTTVSETVRYTGLKTKDFAPPETIQIQRDGKQLQATLQDFTVESEGVSQAQTGRSIHLSANTNFGYTTSLPSPGQSKSVSYRDEATGKTITANLPLERMDTQTDWHWRDDVEIPITVTTYDANTYLLNGKEIPKNEETPALEGHENDLLAALNLSPDSYRITSCQWDGEPYTNESGELCRNAVAYGQRYVIQCQAVFSGSVPLPPIEKETYQGIATYTATAKQPTGEMEYQVEGIATYQALETNQISIPILIVSIGILVLILLALLVILLLAKRRKKKAETGR